MIQCWRIINRILANTSQCILNDNAFATNLINNVLKTKSANEISLCTLSDGNTRTNLIRPGHNQADQSMCD